MANDAKDAPPSSHSSFQRFEKVMKALVQVPKKEIERKVAKERWKRRRKSIHKSA